MGSSQKSVGIHTNEPIAARLDEAASLLAGQGANPFRVRAYRRGASALRRLEQPVVELLRTGGLPALEDVQDIGPGLARTIRDVVRLGYSPLLHRLRGETDPVKLFMSVPGIGRVSADRLHEGLHLETLEDLESAAHDGRLETMAGFGPKRLSGVRAALAERLGRVRAQARVDEAPSVRDLLDIDREYRKRASAGLLPAIAPKRFNPAGRAWLPVLHTMRGDRHYTALFSNTARAHELGRTHDWVVIYRDDRDGDGQWTVVTARTGALQGRRVVRGREPECTAFYQAAEEAFDQAAEDT